MMRGMLRYRPSPATAIALTALVVALGGVAYATIPDSNGTIHGCYQKPSGNLRVVESSSQCRGDEQSLDWNQQGPPGPPGSSVAYDEKADEVTTDSLTPVDLGGPSVTVNVSQSGLIGVFARADLGRGRVTLSEPTDFDPPLSLLANCCSSSFVRGWTAAGNTAGTANATFATRLILEATPGVHTYRLEYQAYGPDASTRPGRFRNRKLWVEPLG
jgi:hypothetical protein